MTSIPDSNDDDSFIILGTSPGSSLDLKCNGLPNGDMVMDKEQMEEAMKDLSVEANMAFKAHFELGDSPSPASMMVASTMITEDKSTEELQKKFGEILDENVILKETLKQNNDSMKEQFLLIATCQEDMMKTHVMHKEKFEETKELVERLRQENKKLKLDITRLAESSGSVNSETGEKGKSGPSSAVEFVTSPDDDVVNKLTAQLELVEKQRRQVIVDNEKLTWQKESLENIVDATTKERDELKDKLKSAELLLLNKEVEYITQINDLKCTVQHLHEKQIANNKSSEQEVSKRNFNNIEEKMTSLKADLRKAQMRILELENVKMSYTNYKLEVNDMVKVYKDQIYELQTRITEACTTVFQPVRVSINSEQDTTHSDFAKFSSNVKLYDRTLKHLADLLNSLTHGLSDSLNETLGLVISLCDYKLERTSVEQFKNGLAEVKCQLEKQHTSTLNNIVQVKSTMSIFEGIFKDHNELLSKSLNKEELKRQSGNVETLTAALVARGHEIQRLEEELNRLKTEKEDREVLKAQLDLYRSDFEAERQSREKMASEKENIMTDLRTTQRQNQTLLQQLDEVRKINPSIYRTATMKRPQGPSQRQETTSRSSPGSTTGRMVPKKKKICEESKEEARAVTPPPQRFDCPVCDQSFKTVILLQQHVDHCLS